MSEAIIGNNVFIEKAIVPTNMKIPDGTVIRASNDVDEIILITEEVLEEIHKKAKQS